MEQQRSQVISSSENGLVTVDRNFRVTFCNSVAKAILPANGSDLWQRDIREILTVDEDFRVLGRNLQDAMAKGGGITERLSFPLVRGQVNRLLVSRITTMADMDGQLLGAAIIFLTRDGNCEASNLALDSIADGVFTVDQEWRITSFNRAAEYITGWKEEEVLGRPCRTIFRTNICGKDCAIARSFLSSAGLSETQIYITHKDGHSVPVAVSASPLLDLDGQQVGGVEIFRDISNKLQCQMTINAVADGVFTVNEQGEITLFNKAAENITGWKEEEVLGKLCSEIFLSSAKRDSCPLNICMREKRTLLDREIFIIGKDGYSIPVSVSSAPFIDHRGKVVGGVETFRDNTARLQNALILDSIAEGVFTVDRDWRIQSFNHAAELITGWSREKAIGSSCSDVFHSSICGKNCAIAESLYTGRPVANRSITIFDSNGKEKSVSISAAPLVDQDGNVIGGVETFRDLSVEINLRRQLARTFSFDEIISKSPAMQRLFQILPDIAKSDSTVLIMGESGTGKELVARAIYHASTRSEQPFVAVNCGALPETLLESELFGYKAGAFTDAKKDRQGRFAAAEGGTLFLDEIGDIPQSLQVKLLRVLQQKVYEPLGSNVSIRANVRILAATNRDLKQLVAEGRFRDDLYYRLNVVDIHLPPLRERLEDIPLLVEHCVFKLRDQKHKDINGLNEEALAVLMRHGFPGNIRELENILEYAFILCPGGLIGEQHLPEYLGKRPDTATACFYPGAGMTLEQIEKEVILQSLERNGGRKMKTCRELGISKDTLRRKLASYGMADEEERG